MPAGRPKSINNDRVFDVAKPNKAKPVGTSRPVIVNHAASVTDASMVNNQPQPSAPVLAAPSATRKIIRPISINSAEESAPTAAPSEPATSSIVILNEPKVALKNAQPTIPTESAPTLPPTAPVVADPETTNEEPLTQPAETTPTAGTELTEPQVETEAEPAIAEPAATPAANESTDATPAEESKPDVLDAEAEKPEADDKESTEPAASTDDADAKEAPADSAIGSDAASVGAVAEASTKNKEEQKAAEEQAKKDAALQELIDSKKYFVPLAHDATQRTGHSATWAGLLVLVLLVVGGYLAIDAKLIHVAINLPYHFFKQ